MTSEAYKFGVIGYGMSAKVFHIPIIKVVPQFVLYAAIQRHPKPEDNVEEGIKSYRSTEDMVSDDAVDVTSLHKPLLCMSQKRSRSERCVSAHEEVVSTGLPSALATRSFHETRKGQRAGCGSPHYFP